jgi:beta-glucosidase
MLSSMATRRQFLGGLLAASGAAWLPACGGKVEGSPRLGTPSFYWGVGIENTWMVQADPVKDGARRALDEFALTEHYDRWQADLDLAARLGAVAIRYSIPWYRAEPTPGSYDWSWIDSAIAYLVQELRIVPILDLLHYGTPAWLADGIGSAGFEDAFARYATAIGEHFRGRVTHFTPCNEPAVSVAFSGAQGVWPPYEKSTEGWAELGVRLARAMARATRNLRDAVPGAVIVSADAIDWLLADSIAPVKQLPPDQAEALRVATGSFPACLAYGKPDAAGRLAKFLVAHGAAQSDLDWLAAHAAPPDILGYNHYPDVVDYPGPGDFTRGGSLPLAEAAREATDKVEAALRRAQSYFARPVYLSETSAGLTAGARAAYATALYDMVERLRDDAVPIIGVNWWPLYEAAQWTYREEPGAPLADFITPGGWNNALYDLAPEPDGSLPRVETSAAAAFRAIIARDHG